MKGFHETFETVLAKFPNLPPSFRVCRTKHPKQAFRHMEKWTRQEEVKSEI